MPRRYNLAAALFLIQLVAATAFSPAQAQALKIGYSDWPGWVAWEVAVEKDWFKEAGVEVVFEWFDYVASMDAFAAGQIDAVCMTNGDALVTGSSGAPSVAVLVNDYSNGNDMVVAAPGIDNVSALKGRRIGVEVGFVSHLLLLEALKQHGLTEDDVELVNVPTNETPQVLASGEVAAIVAWQPSSGLALEQVPGSKAVFSSADQPGLIYDVLAVNPASLAARRADWAAVARVWYRVVDYIRDPATRADAMAIMAARVGLTPERYEKFVDGTRILTLDEAKAAFGNGEGFSSLYGSSAIADSFNVANDVYKTPQPIERYLDPTLLQSL